MPTSWQAFLRFFFGLKREESEVDIKDYFKEFGGGQLLF